MRIWRPSVAQEVDEELAFHVEMRTRQLVAGGMTPAEARAAALSGFGDYERVRRTCRDLGERRERGMRRAELIHELRQDARYALRTLRRSPGFTAVAVATLALGLAATTATFSVVDAVLLRPPPYADAGRLVVLWNSYAAIGLTRAAVSPGEYADFRQMERPFEAVGAIGDIGLNLTGRDEPVRLQGYMVSPNFFRVLGARPALGRAFLDEEGTRATNKVVVLSHAVWSRLFGADRGVVGQAVRLNGIPYTVVGVMAPGVRFPDAPGFLYPEPADVWIPYAWELSRDEQSRGDQFLRVIARLKPGVTMSRLRQELAAAGVRWRRQYPAFYPASARWAPAARRAPGRSSATPCTPGAAPARRAR